MPSDPLPLSPETLAGKRFCRGGDARLDAEIAAIEQEARTLARAEVIAEAVAAVDLLPSYLMPGGAAGNDLLFRDDLLAALSRLGERE